MYSFTTVSRPESVHRIPTALFIFVRYFSYHSDVSQAMR